METEGRYALVGTLVLAVIALMTLAIVWLAGAADTIAYQTYTGGKFQIAVMDPATMQERVITPFDASYEDPSWAPDGRHLAAARSVNYSYSVYLLDSMAALGDKPVALTSTGEWTSPAWSR